MKGYFQLQYKMTNRKFKDAGIAPLLAYVLLALVFVGLSLYLFHYTPLAPYIYILFALMLIGGLSDTPRTEFIKQCFGDAVLKKIRIAENLLCAFPFLLLLLYQQQFVAALLLLLLVVALALIHFRTSWQFTIWTPFSKKPFEFMVGFRNNFYWVLGTYALIPIAIGVNNFNLGAFALLLLFIGMLGYYIKPENEYYIWIFQQKPTAFLWAKIKTAWLFASLLALPIVLALALAFPQQVGITLLLLLVGGAFLTSMIVGKYAAYPDPLNIIQGITLALCILFPPLLLILTPYFFKKSEIRLSGILQ